LPEKRIASLCAEVNGVRGKRKAAPPRQCAPPLRTQLLEKGLLPIHRGGKRPSLSSADKRGSGTKGGSRFALEKKVFYDDRGMRDIS